MKTQGISPKAVLAAVLPTLGGLVAVLVQWIATGTFDRAELGTAVGAVLASLLAFAGAYAAAPGDVRPKPQANVTLSIDSAQLAKGITPPPPPRRGRGARGLTLVEVLVVLLIVLVVLLLMRAV